MSLEQFVLEELEVEHFQVREALRCLLHTIIFQRALGAFRPEDVDSELFDITYVRCNDPTVIRSIEEKVDQFAKSVELPQPTKGQVCLSFFEKRMKSAWWSKQEERMYWEQWGIPVAVMPSSSTDGAERRQRQLRLEQNLTDRIAYILRVVNEKHNHLPPVVGATPVCFPFEISIPQGSDGWSVWRRVLSAPPPPGM